MGSSDAGEGDVRDRLGAGRDQHARGRLGAVRDGGDEASGDGDQQLLRGREVRAGGVGHQRGGGDADEGVQRVPEEVEAGDLVGEEFGQEEQAADADDPRIGQRTQRAGEFDPIEVRQDAQRADGGIDVETGREADRDDERCDRAGRDGEGVHEKKANIA